MAARQWDVILVAEHEMIERAMDVLKRELDKLPQADLEPFALQRALDFLLEFGDRLHNQKEERWLFPLLAKRGIPESGPIRVMLQEHDGERKLIAAMAAAAPKVNGLPTADREAFKQQGLAYLETRANHIWKENDVLYAMGRKAFSEADKAALVEAFDTFSAGVYGDDFEVKIRTMIDEVEKGRIARRSLIENLSYEQIDAIMETLPVEVTFVDADDTVAYFNRLDKEKIFVRSRSVVGRKVVKCHPEKSVHMVRRIVEGFKEGTLDKAEFWIDLQGDKIYIRYFPVRGTDGRYMGVLEVTQNIGPIQRITGQKRLLD